MPQESKELLHTHLLDLVMPTQQAAIDRIVSLGIEGAPEEVCGILVQENPSAFRVCQLRNRAEDRCTSYRIDPATLRTLALKPDHWKHVVIFHTHPGGNIGPSLGDLEYRIAGVRYLVVTVPSGEATWF